MTNLVQVAVSLRRAVRGSYGCALGLFAWGAIAFQGFQLPLGIWHAMFGIAWSAALVVHVRMMLRRRRKGRGYFSTNLAVLLLALILVAIQSFDATLSLRLSPLAYIWAAWVGVFGGGRRAIILLGCGGLAFASTLAFSASSPEWLRVVFELAFFAFFGGLSRVFLRAEVARLRFGARRRQTEEQARAENETRMLRLSATSSEGIRDERRLLRVSLDEVHNQLYHVLSLLHQAMDLHTAILLMRDDEGGSLRIVELVTESDDIARGPFRTGTGAVGAVARRGQVTNLEHIKPGYPGICYYEGPTSVRAFLGMPIIEDELVVGALCVDRTKDEPFGAKEEATLRSATRQILRILENERVFVGLERNKNEMTTLYRASQALGAALDEAGVIEAGLSAAREIAAYDFAAVTRFDPSTRKHTVRKAVGEAAAAFADLTFRDNASLTAMAVKNRHYLPYRGDFDPDQQTIYTRRANLKGMESLLILPLIVRETAIGTIALAAERSGAFGDSVRPTLQVLANQVAVALSNAASVRRLEEMATIDGLTGCLNKRAFHEELTSKLRAANRFDRPVSLIVTDLDHFKTVNDTYGHATGDQVLKELGNILRRMKRDTDVVARFGGEEFCVLCEETDTEGAIRLAERVREALEMTTFQTEMGPLKLTCSLGVATFPSDAKGGDELFEAADRALYQAKNGGRNRVCAAKQARAA